MKRKISIAVCISLLMGTLISCSPKSQLPPDSENETKESLTELAAEETEWESVSEETESTITDTDSSETTVGITDEEVVALIDKKLLYEEYIEFGGLSTGTEKMHVMRDNSLYAYFKIEDERFDTWEEWMAFVESIYAWGGLTSILNQYGYRMINIDGYTYTVCQSIEGGILDEYTYKIVESLPEIALVEIIRPQHITGKYTTIERRWFWTMAKTEMGWRITNIFPFT